MTLKASFASVLRALRSKRNITQRDFADTTSRTYLSKLELGKSSITLDKLDQVSRRLELSPLTLLTLTLSEETGKPPSELVSKLQLEIAGLQQEEGLPGLRMIPEMGHQVRRLPRRARSYHELNCMQAELAFVD
ncbi:helix-turn-helix transcriptional regulator [Pseudomonas sp. WHRI 8519]|uniref:helix-turn-helix domain-containing protein n=1 Tax=Pseudomonas sp. WHRI 8519 TaxID=3162567 RepID=UPI0032F04ABE